MDLKSFYKKIDVESIKNRLPPLPQIKMPKIKSRKIFKTSREDISQKEQQSPMGGPSPLTTQSLPPPSAFIDRTPTRISTVSSLMNINYGLRDNSQSGLSTYRTANNFEEENCPDKLENGDTASGSAVTKFSDRCKKTYKDFSEFKVKNIFNRKTVVKRTEIEVDIYARQYERELQEEQERDNQQEEDNVYQFEFKQARRRMSKSSGSISPPDSLASGVPSPLRSELGQLQRNETPPLLARRRNIIDEAGPSRHRMQRSMSEDSAPDEPPRKPLRSSLWGISEKDVVEDTGDEQPVSSYRSRIAKMGRFRKSRKDVSGEGSPPQTDSAWNLRNIRNRFSSEDSGAERKPRRDLSRDESVEAASDHEKRGWKLRNIHLRRSESSEKNNEPPASSPEGKFSSIKKSLQRLNQRKPQRENSEESEKDQNLSEEPTKPNISDQLKAGLRRLKLRERSFTFDEDAGETKAAQAKTPPAKTAQAIAANKLRNWKKSFKVRRASEEAPDEDAQPSAPPPSGRSATLLRKLNHIRSRKVGSVEDDEVGDSTAQKDDSQKPRSSNFEKLEHAREKALKKVNEQVQKMKKFHGKSRDSPTESSPEKPKRAQKSLKKKAAPPGGEVPTNVPAAWTSGKVISRSLQSSMDLSDDDAEMPQVLIHQDNSDQYESTLIIAVTRPAPPVPSPIIKEITPKVKPNSEWIPNKNAISSFLEMSPSPPRSTRHLDVSRGHFRKQSMDSNDSDSWIPDNFRNKSCASSSSGGLNKIHENAEPWKVHSVFSEEKLYKTRSIDIFSNRDGGAFVDFDDEMKNVPVRRIAAAIAESVDKESTDDEDDYDNSSRITRLKGASPLISTKAAIETKGAPKPTKALLETVRSDSLNKSIDSTRAYHGSPLATKTKGQIGNSQESLDANYAESDEVSSGNEDDCDEPPNMAPSPPPTFSPPPPPLPLRKPPRNLPERNDSMVRLAHPLVKQASLRRHFSEEIEPSDLGKVNKLICRFEKSPSQDSVQRIQMIAGDDNDNEDDWTEQPPTEVVDIKPPVKPKEDGATRNGGKKRPAPIPVPVLAPRQTDDVPKIDFPHNNNNNIEIRVPERPVSPEIIYHQNHNQSLDNASLQSPSSVYGSPIGSVCLSERISISSEYGSPVGMAFPTKSTDQLRAGRRLSNRSSLRDDDTFYSFESDEENNFYSFGESSTSSTRYTIEI